MTEQQAKNLAKFDKEYVARKMQGKWIVWSFASDHVVEFDAAQIEHAKQED